MLEMFDAVPLARPVPVSLKAIPLEQFADFVRAIARSSSPEPHATRCLIEFLHSDPSVVRLISHLFCHRSYFAFH